MIYHRRQLFSDYMQKREMVVKENIIWLQVSSWFRSHGTKFSSLIVQTFHKSSHIYTHAQTHINTQRHTHKYIAKIEEDIFVSIKKGQSRGILGELSSLY